MHKLSDRVLLDRYISRYGIEDIFSSNIRCCMELVLFKKNEYLLQEGEDVNKLLFLVDGKARVYTTLQNGKSLLLCFYQSLRMLGDVEIFNVQPSSSSVQAIDDCYCIAISMEAVRAHLLNDAKFLCFIVKSLGEKLVRCSKNSSINLLYPLENRLASYILATSQKSDNKDRKDRKFKENLTQIAELLGTSYRHLLRTLNILDERGAIRKEGSYYLVQNEEILREMAADVYK